jgi:hypothetical protein
LQSLKRKVQKVLYRPQLVEHRLLFLNRHILGYSLLWGGLKDEYDRMRKEFSYLSLVSLPTGHVDPGASFVCHTEAQHHKDEHHHHMQDLQKRTGQRQAGGDTEEEEHSEQMTSSSSPTNNRERTETEKKNRINKHVWISFPLHQNLIFSFLITFCVLF